MSFILVVLVILAFIIYDIYFEYKVWNNGICKASGKPWSRINFDSWSDRDYRDYEGNYCTMSWPADYIKETNNASRTR